MSFALRRIFLSSFGMWMLLAAVSCYLLYPPMKKLKFGIDLVGGTYITLALDRPSVIQPQIRSYTSHALSELSKIDTIVPTFVKNEKESVVYTFENSIAAQKAASYLSQLPSSKVRYTVNNDTVEVVLADGEAAYALQQAVLGNVDILRRRLNALGVEEISVAAQGNENIVVELPDVHDTAQAKKMIGTPAVLEFKLVDGVAASKEQLLANYGGEVPFGLMVLPGDDYGRQSWFMVAEYSPVTGQMIEAAHPSFDQQSMRSAVAFRLKPEGAEKFRELTGQNIGKQLAIVLDGKVIQHATIQSEISDSGQITMGGGENAQAETQRLAMLLKSGAFTGKMNFAEERRIGSSLGADSIKAGLVSCAVGLLVLLVFSLLYYKLAGLFAFLALVFNLLFILVCLYFLGAALTLPGIGGMVLTIGMAIDCSILIYEKIKECLKQGMAPAPAVAEGFSDALGVILDSNITTFLTGIVLYKFGTGPIRGFALTMMVGIVATLVTGIWFLRSIFNVVLSKKNVQKLSI